MTLLDTFGVADTETVALRDVEQTRSGGRAHTQPSEGGAA